MLKYDKNGLYNSRLQMTFPCLQNKKFEYPAILEKYNVPIKKIETDFISKKNKAIIKYDCILNTEEINKLNKIIKLDYLDLEECTKNNNFSIFTDGSVYQSGNYHFGSTAVIIIYNGKIIFKESQLINDKIDTNMSELLAIISAIQYLESECREALTKKVFIHTDSLFALNIFTYDGYSKRLIDRINENDDQHSLFLHKNSKKFINLCEHYKSVFDLYFVWIKGHTSSEKDIFSKYNNMCDVMCKNIIGKKLKLLTKNHI